LCFYPNLGKIWTNMSFKMFTQLQLSLLTVYFLITFLTQHLGLSIFDPNLTWNNPFFRVCVGYCCCDYWGQTHLD